MDECKTSEEQLHENEEERWKKCGSDEVKEKNNIDKGECNDRGTLNSENGEKILKTRKKWMGKEEVELTGRQIVEEGMMKIKGTFLKI